MDLKVKKADKQEVEIAYALLVSCGKEMYEKFALRHWYPFMDIEIFKATLHTKCLYMVYQYDIPVATFNLSTYARDYYAEELWSIPSQNPSYLGQLGIKPNLQGNGMGKWCMAEIEKIAKENKHDTLRFDAVDTHPWLNLFYKKLGYSPCAAVQPQQWKLVCFEKALL
jgi:GNAT superfamily N-acetyltransferase